MQQLQQFQPDNSPESVRLRKSQNTLIVVGAGIMMFGLWTVVKSLGMVFLDPEILMADARTIAAGSGGLVTERLLFTAMLVVVAVYLFFGLTARCIIGFSAIAEGRGRRRGKVYLPLTVVFIILNILEINAGVLRAVFGNVAETVPGNSLLVSLIIELTSMIMMVQLLSAVRHVRKFEKAKQAKE